VCRCRGEIGIQEAGVRIRAVPRDIPVAGRSPQAASRGSEDPRYSHCLRLNHATITTAVTTHTAQKNG
jgi:hypothetical protein